MKNERLDISVRVERKKQTLELVDTLREALQFLNSPAASTAPYLHDDCVACIGAICSVLDEVINKKYTIYSSACEADIQARNYDGAYKWADVLSIWIHEHVQVHYEIVFMPYKAEMWDAFDSVWRAASADPSCIVRTIPIPYSSLNPQRGTSIEVYEGDKFPSYVEITHYKNYDLNNHHPDVIFIHNPYDDLNTVTKVHPTYFSSNLMKYTNKLVYIPYFISIGQHPPHFKLPSLKNAWRTFVQSESTRDEFLASKQVNPDQIVAMGSPKIDHMLDRMQQNVSIPAEWEQALQGRTIFLFNTSLGRLLSEKEDIIKSIQEVIRHFQINKDIAIIWRPHPLSIETIKSMKPQLLHAYDTLVKNFKRMSNAVYDESAEMHTAIIHSDAYIGDFSSVLAPYALTGKPVMKLMPNIKASIDFWGVSRAWLDYKDESMIPLRLSSGFVSNNEFIFAADNRGGVYSLDLSSGESRLSHVFSQDGYSEPQLYAKIVNYQDDIWFVPKRASQVISYNQKTGVMKSLSLPAIFQFEGYHRFSNAVQHGQYLWMLPAESKMVVQLDMTSGEMKSYEVIMSESFLTEEMLSYSNGVITNGSLWITCQGQRSLIQMDLVTGEMKHHELSFLQDSIQAIASDGMALWIVSPNGPTVTKWNPVTEELNVYNQWPKGFMGGPQPFSEVIFAGEYIWLVPHDANSILKISSETGVVSVVYSNIKKSLWSKINGSYPFDSVERNRSLKNNDALYSGAVLHENWIWFCPITAPFMLGIHLKTGEMKKINVEMSREQDEKNIIVYRYPQPPKVGIDLRSTFNDRSLPLKSFIEMVCRGENEAWSNKQSQEVYSSISNADGTSGQRIWDYIVERLAY